MKKTGLFMALVFGLSVVTVSVFAKDLLEANTLKDAQISSAAKFGTFTVLAAGDKGVNVDTLTKPVKSADGAVFTSRIKLNGAGDATMRSISFTIAKGAKVTVYLNSGSKTEDRTLIVANKDGDIAGEITAPKDNEADAGSGIVEIKKAGEYFIYSKKSGINVYKVVVE